MAKIILKITCRPEHFFTLCRKFPVMFFPTEKLLFVNAFTSREVRCVELFTEPDNNILFQ
jgi:hypothetical protein